MLVRLRERQRAVGQGAVLATALDIIGDGDAGGQATGRGRLGPGDQSRATPTVSAPRVHHAMGISSSPSVSGRGDPAQKGTRWHLEREARHAYDRAGGAARAGGK